MAGSAMTFTYAKSGRPIKSITVDWTSDDTTGAVSGTTATVSGYLLKGITDPGATAPTASYDIVLTDAEGTNLLADCFDDLVDRHTSTTEAVNFITTETEDTAARPCVSGPITVSVSNAGNSKVGQLILLVDGEIIE